MPWHTILVAISHEPVPLSIQLVFLTLLPYLIWRILLSSQDHRPIPHYPIPTLPGLKPRQAFERHGIALLQKGFAEFPNQPFQVFSSTGPRIVLPNRFATEVSQHPHLSFTKSIKVEFFPQYPGFEGPRATFEENHARLIQDVVRVRLTQSLGLIAGDLVDEASYACHLEFGESEVWRPVRLRNDTAEFIARLSSRVFLRPEICRDERWIELAKSYTENVFAAAHELRALPSVLRPVLVWFLPHCRRIRKQVRAARRLIASKSESRKLEAERAQSSGAQRPRTTNAIAWMVELSKGEPFDVVASQLALIVGAVFTASEALAHALLHLCQNPDIIEPLREEASLVLQERGWTKAALHRLRLMDSFLKESQRLHRERWGLQRYAEEDIQLSDETEIPKGCRIMIEARHFDAELFLEPEKFDAYRFLRKREDSGQESNWQFISTCQGYLGFGLGRHECPGYIKPEP
ncbi:cytochrome P450 [Lecanosticta acicola]|uniref:Cytochrome P450 n=1 Tax=Lecanosticta acicola TaxID=111012 RepID=A0AAI8Z3P9_9PEZI|nr:cytochrome P450 [Lecanosticta acicola]